MLVHRANQVLPALTGPRGNQEPPAWMGHQEQVVHQVCQDLRVLKGQQDLWVLQGLQDH